MQEQECAPPMAVILMHLDQGPPLEPLHTVCPITQLQKVDIFPASPVFWTVIIEKNGNKHIL